MSRNIPVSSLPVPLNTGLLLKFFAKDTNIVADTTPPPYPRGNLNGLPLMLDSGVLHGSSASTHSITGAAGATVSINIKQTAHIFDQASIVLSLKCVLNFFGINNTAAQTSTITVLRIIIRRTRADGTVLRTLQDIDFAPGTTFGDGATSTALVFRQQFNILENFNVGEAIEFEFLITITTTPTGVTNLQFIFMAANTNQVSAEVGSNILLSIVPQSIQPRFAFLRRRI